MKEIKEITVDMLPQELVNTLNYNFKKLDEDAKATRKYLGDKFDKISTDTKEMRTDIHSLKKGIDKIIAYLKSDNDKSLLKD